MQRYIFLFTISPVQTFIEQARKTQDLYAASKILSELITYAMEQTKLYSKSYNFIFPSETAPSKPNRFIGIIEPANISMQELGEKVQEDVINYFVNILGKNVLNLYSGSEAQLRDFLNVYWVADAYKEEIMYKNQIKSIEEKLGAIKNIKYFNQFPEKGRKCSLDGQYNVKFYRLASDEQENDRLFNKKLFHRNLKVIATKDFKTLSISKLRPGEGVSAISMLKRLYIEDDKKEFESTSNIALLDTLNKLSKSAKGNQLLNEFVLCVELDKTDWKHSKNGQLFYDENLTKHYFKKQGLPDGGLKCAQDKLKELSELTKSEKLIFSKYYAILLFDADSIGKKLEKCKTIEEHKKLSDLLANFARFAQAYIDGEGLDKIENTKELNQDKKGRTVYAGGDDFLGFINLNYLFNSLKTLREQFDKRVNEALGEEFAHLKLTFSAGVAIAHYKTPLGEVLSWARKMEKKAKGVLHKTDDNIKKDAFAVAILKRSGEIHDTVWRWLDEEGVWSTNRFGDLIESLKNKELSKSFINNLCSEIFKIINESGQWGKSARDNDMEDELEDILDYQLEYFMLRAKSEGTNKTNIIELANKLFNLYKTHTNFELSPLNFLNMLSISEFISRHINPIPSDVLTTKKIEA